MELLYNLFFDYTLRTVAQGSATLGLVLLTAFIQKMPNANQAGLDKFLFGQAAALVERDVKTMASLGIIALLIPMLCYWESWRLLHSSDCPFSDTAYPNHSG